MVGSWSDMNQGSRFGRGTAFMTGRGSEEPCPKGDRAFVRAQKRGNARGAKEGRKVEARKTEHRNKDRRECPRELHKTERSVPDGHGWKLRSGQSACWQPWKRGLKEENGSD